VKLETDVRRIASLAQQSEEANWRFRCFLKGCDLAVEEIDAMVHGLFRSVSKEIDCRECGNCCEVVQPVLNDDDIARLAGSLGTSAEAFTAEYLVEDMDDEGYTFNSSPCPFLSGKSCSVYPDRPSDCRSCPHLQKHDFVFRVNQAFSNCSVCPIVFNVYERLKAEVWDRDVEFRSTECERAGPSD
jgi:Fe-S-cluster containining protein